MLACGLFPREDNLNVPYLSELYFLYNILQGDRLDPGSSFVNQLHNTATSSAHRIVIGGLITPIHRLVEIELNPNDRFLSFEWLNLTPFEQMKFCKVEARRIC